ncbi:helix-turn-helix domain-containing protein [Geobacter sp.]|uniref:helix-turn-helix domain-containing protein n=1 Tax=Geobacter sp. TaxID=46610 RepID=UPI002625F4C0|nr:helix-turn-helix domain-containing protein [Geobacter sp.]
MPANGEIYNPWRMFNGSFIPNAILKCRELSATAKLLFGRLCQYAGADGEAFPSYSTLGQEVGIERRQAIRAIRELEDFGLIRAVARRRDDGSHCSNSYVFLWHTIFSEDGSPPSGGKNGAKGSVTNDTTPQCHPRHQVVPAVTPKEIQTREEETTTELVRLLLSGTPLSEISDPELQVLLRRHGIERMTLVGDVATETWRREPKEIRNPAGYLHSLCDSLIVPSWYQTPEERKAKAAKAEELRSARKKAEEAEKAAMEKDVEAKESFWASLSDADRENFRTAALASMSPGIKWPEVAITAIAKSMAWERCSRMGTNEIPFLP